VDEYVQLSSLQLQITDVFIFVFILSINGESKDDGNLFLVSIVCRCDAALCCNNYMLLLDESVDLKVLYLQLPATV